MSAAGRDLGTFPVAADAAECADFRAALGDKGEGPALPLTFPMRWLAGPAVRAALLALVPEPDLIPVHEAQSFTYAGVLSIGETYALHLTARREAPPDRLVVDGIITAADGRERARTETVLRLISTTATAA